MDRDDTSGGLAPLRDEVQRRVANARIRDDQMRALRVEQARAGVLPGYEGLTPDEAELLLLQRERHVAGQAAAGYAIRLATARVALADAERRRSGAEPTRGPSSGRVFLPELPCLSVFDAEPAPVRGVGVGGITVPLAQVPHVAYFPDIAVPVTPGGYVPLESMDWPEVHEFWMESEGAREVDLDHVAPVDEDVCVLSNIFSMTFGHWLTEELVTLFVHEAAGFEGRYVINDRFGEGLPSFIPDSLALLGVDPGRVIWSLAGPTRFRSVSYAPVITHDLAGRYPDVYLAYRDWILAAAGVPEPRGGRRIWLVREEQLSGGRSGLVNQAEVMELVERHGFEAVDPGRLTFAEQIRVMSEASVLAGAHGSATRHSLFMPERSTVVECFSPHLANKTNAAYFRLLRHDYHMIMMESAYEDYPWGVDVCVDLDHLALVLDRLDD